jgi:hypothetical protein
MIRRISFLALALTLSATACGDHDGVLVDPLPEEGVAGNLAEQRQRWERQGIDDYRVAFSRECFCAQPGTVQVTVRDGRVTDVRQVANGQPVPRETLPEYLTVDALFDAIAAAQSRNDYTSSRFHPTLGYPVEAEIGTLANDAGVRYILSGLVPID